MKGIERIPYRFIEFWDEFPAFRYHSLIADGDNWSITSQTMQALEADEKMLPLVKRFVQMMRQIGRRCKNINELDMLRGERAARALPPEADMMRRINYLREFGRLSPIPSLRWYSYGAGYQTLLLFGLGLKTTNNPEDCPNVASLFKFAVRASNYLDDNPDDWTVNGLQIVLTDEDTPLLL